MDLSVRLWLGQILDRRAAYGSTNPFWYRDSGVASVITNIAPDGRCDSGYSASAGGTKKQRGSIT